MRNIFAYTKPGASYPEFISLNERDGEIVLTARPSGDAATVDVVLPREQAEEFYSALGRYLRFS